MSITQLFSPDEFFTAVAPNSFAVGQLCWIPAPMPEPVPRILDVNRNRPEEHEEVQFELRLANHESDFKKSDRSLPIKYLNLRSNEELLCQRCKKRTGVIIGTKVDCYPEITKLLPSKGKKHQQQECMFVVPCYSVQNEGYGKGFIQPIVERTKCLMYRQFFYLPSWQGHPELIARFDRTQMIIGKDPATIEPTGTCLSEEVFNTFLAMFIFCVSGEADKTLEATINLCREAYPRE